MSTLLVSCGDSTHVLGTARLVASLWTASVCEYCCCYCDPLLVSLTSPEWEHEVQHILLVGLPEEACSKLEAFTATL